MAPFTKLDHVQLAMPSGGESRARGFYVGTLGFEEVPKPADLARRGGLWLRSGEVRLHLGVDPDFRPAGKAHPALRCSDFDSLIARLINSGIDVIPGDRPVDGTLHCYVSDPFGNRIELIGDGNSSAEAAETVEWFFARTKGRKPEEVTARELVIEGRRE